MKLAINGGQPIRTEPFPKQVAIGVEEFSAVNKVMTSGVLSAYRGNESGMMGGPQVRALEAEWCKYFGSQYAIPVNSCTSALQIACGAIGLKPGDEVIVTPWSMTCSATAPLMFGATPVFADIDPETYCLDPESVIDRITPYTKAIIAVDLFGKPCDWDALREIAKVFNLYLIQDSAQAIGSEYNGVKTGRQGDISCFSFTTGKILTAGEGGMLMTDNITLAERCRLIMNHAESIVNDMDKGGFGFVPSIDGDVTTGLELWGCNMRMTEIQAAIIREQLKKLDSFIHTRRVNALALSVINDIPMIDCSIYDDSVYYAQAFKYSGTDRDRFIDAVNAELPGGEIGRPDKKAMIGKGYIKPIYLMPVFQVRDHKTYKAGSCQVAEDLYFNKLFVWTLTGLPLTQEDVVDVYKAFKKVDENRREL